MFLKNLIWHNFRLRKVARVIQRIPGYPSLKVNSCLLSLFFPEPFKSNTTKYFNVFPLKKQRIFLHNHSAMIKIRKLNSDTILLYPMDDNEFFRLSELRRPL